MPENPYESPQEVNELGHGEDAADWLSVGQFVAWSAMGWLVIAFLTISGWMATISEAMRLR